MYSEYNRTSGADTGTTAVAVTLARAQLALSARGTICSSLPAQEVRMAQPERLPDTAGLGEQCHQEPVPQMLARAEERRDLPGPSVRGPGDHELDRPSGDWLALAHVVQERLIRAPAHPEPGDQVGGQPTPARALWS